MTTAETLSCSLNKDARISNFLVDLSGLFKAQLSTWHFRLKELSCWVWHLKLLLSRLHISPGQREVQVIFCTDIPSQKAPPLRGAGLVQVRDRFCQPRPHRALQFDHSVHDDQPPLTAKHKHAWGCARCARRHQANLIRSSHSKAEFRFYILQVNSKLKQKHKQLHKGHGVKEHKCLFWKSNMLSATTDRVWEGGKSRHLNSHKICFA